ncbi:MAG TPA: acyltransferase domain-containing protein, partial [Polyangiales bacterium]
MLAEFLLRCLAATGHRPSTLIRTPPSSHDGERGLEGETPLALVGIGCRLPGGIATPAQLWEALVTSTDAVAEVPPQRWDVKAIWNADRSVEGTTNSRWGGFLDDVMGFDAAFFGISPREAACMDPQQRIALEVTWEALENAGIVPQQLAGTRTGVFFGAWAHDYADLMVGRLEAVQQHSATGWNTSVIPARIARALGTYGPALTVNTAHSSSLVALHLAAESLRRGESDLALVGGVNLILSPNLTVQMTKFGGLSPTGRCRAFDAGADGHVRSEGCAVVVLRRLADAVAAGDRIYAVVAGTAVNSGSGDGLSVPSSEAQQRVLRAAWEMAEVAPAQVRYVEAHGTGTPVGDPVEAHALHAALGQDREVPLLLGSVKTNLGHLEAAAGLAGLLKTALAIHRGRLPASLHFETPNPRIPFAEWKLCVVDALRTWPPDGERFAGVSSFGFGGANAHVALREATGSRAVLLPIAARDGDEWRQRIDAVSAQLAASADDQSLSSWMSPQGEGPLRVVVRGRDPEALREALRSVRDEPGARRHVALARASIAFFFAGDVAAWPTMGAELLASEPTFRRAFTRAVDALAEARQQTVLDSDVSGALDVEDAVRFAFQVAMGRMLLSWGVRPTFVIGSGLGELAAAVVAGLLPLAAAARFIVAGPAAAAEVPAREALDTQTLAMWSSDEAKFVERDTLHARYWERALARPVHVEPRQSHAPRCDLGVDIGPAGADAFGAATRIASCDPGGSDWQSLDSLVERLWCAGVELDWDRVAGRSAQPCALPLVLSGRDDAALRAQAARWAGWLAAHPGTSYADAVRSAQCERTHFDRRAALLVDDVPAAIEALRAVADERAHPAVVLGTAHALGRVVFVFPGQGSQWPAMGRTLWDESPEFRAAVCACDAALAPYTGWSVASVLRGEYAAAPPLTRVDVVQPALFTMGVALAAVWRSLGLSPAAVVGTSQGEVAAAVVCGALSLDDGARVVALRSRLLVPLAGTGGMAVIARPVEEVERLLVDERWALSVAGVNTKGSTIVSGDSAAVDAFVERRALEAVFCRRIEVDYASHSAHVDRLLTELAAELQGLRPQPTRIPMVSTLTAAVVVGTELDADYWCRNLREPFRLDLGLEVLKSRAENVFVEVSAHPVLAVPLTTASAEGAGAVAGTLRRDAGGLRSFWRELGSLHVQGHAVAWSALARGRGHVDLPTYAFQRQPFWLDSARGREDLTAQGPRAPSALRKRLAPLPESQRLGALVTLVQETVAAVLGMASAAAVPLKRPLKELGLDSLTGVEVRSRLCARTETTLPATLVFDYPTPEAIAQLLLRAAFSELSNSVEAEPQRHSQDEPIAIVGMACR